MTLQSVIPSNLDAATRIREYQELVRELSLAKDPQQLLASYRQRSRFVVTADHYISLSRRGLSNGQLRITRTSRWEEPINPWKQPERLPIIESGLLRQLMDAATPVKLDQIELAADDPAAPLLEGMNSLLASPIFHAGEPTYMVVVLREQPAAFKLDELATLLLTSNLIGRATSHLVMAEELRAAYAELDREFDLVGQIQRGLLPQQMPVIPGVEIASHYETSRRAGGDYYDFMQTPGGAWGFFIADVSGHGPPAAVVMAMLRTLFRLPSELCSEGSSPACVLTHLNKELFGAVPLGQFVTAFLAFYHPSTRRLEYAVAGHNPPRWLRVGDGAVWSLMTESGLPLALDEDGRYCNHEIQVAAGDRLLLYTDGITETFNRAGEMFGSEGLDAALRRSPRTAASIVAQVLSSVEQFSGGARPDDDRTLLALAFD